MFGDLTAKARFGRLQRHLSDLDYWHMRKGHIVEKHLAWLRPRAWLAIDDEAQGWTDRELACHVVLTPPPQGLLDPEAQAKLVGLREHQPSPAPRVTRSCCGCTSCWSRRCSPYPGGPKNEGLPVTALPNRARAASSAVLTGVDEKLRHRPKHCRLCRLPSEHCTPLPDEPDLSDDELGFPMTVAPWMGGAP